MTDRGKAVGKHALTGALAALVGAAATWLAGHALPQAGAAQPTEVAVLRSAMDARFDRLEMGQHQLGQRLSHLEGVWDARRAVPAREAR